MPTYFIQTFHKDHLLNFNHMIIQKEVLEGMVEDNIHNIGICNLLADYATFPPYPTILSNMSG